MAYWTSMNINQTSVKPTLSNECMDGLFGAFILLKVHTKTYEFQHQMTMKQDMKNKFHLDNFLIPFPCGSICLNQN
jgi:hypothetical protein